METVIKELTQKLKDFKHWERLALIKGENKKADQYGKYAKEYQQAIKVLCEGKSDGTSEKDLRVCEVSKQGLFAEYLSQAMNTFGAKVEVQYVDYSKGTWTAPVRLTESRINQITNDNSVKNIRLSFPF